MYEFYSLKDMYGNDVKLVETGEDYRTYKIINKNGEGVMTIYKVFEGVQLLYNNFNSSSCYTDTENCPNVISINHCFKGRFECNIGEHYIYMGEGDLAISRLKGKAKRSSFPLGKYEGVTLLIDPKVIPKLVSKMLDEVSINIEGLLKKLALSNDYFVIRANESIQHVFTELYQVKPCVRKGYFKLKVMEALLFLTSDGEALPISDKKYHTYAQVEKIKAIRKYLISDLTTHITIDKLADKFNISKTAFKDCFKDVYGESPYAYLRKYRIDKASIMIKESKKSISEIAGMVGYQNVSKFSNAFKDIKGITPRDYRKN